MDANGVSETVSRRYSHAYGVSVKLERSGEHIKGGAIAVFLTLFVISVNKSVSDSAVYALLAVGIYAIGVAIGGIAQVLRATLDHAVNSSPFLSDAGRMAAMGLTPAPAAPKVFGDAATWDCACGKSNHWSATVCARCGAALNTAG